MNQYEVEHILNDVCNRADVQLIKVECGSVNGIVENIICIVESEFGVHTFKAVGLSQVNPDRFKALAYNSVIDWTN